ncbi:MAG: MYG1 family protein [Candidatus Pacebacteria bacterium]|nr:MYG1 family protein [Candidatus Paceibacterota bacterium]
MFFKRKKKVVTHCGSFHADDIFACATLSLYFKKNNMKYTVTRTRDEQLIKAADYVFDVGGIYEPELERFDHHQSGGAGKRKNEIPYAAFGLVWKKYGPLLCNGNDEIVADIDRRLVQPIDAIDNGISISEPVDCGLYDYGIHGIVSSYQNTWKEAKDTKKQLKSFLKLVDFFAGIISREIEQSSNRTEMISIIEKCYQDSENKEIIEIPYHVGVGPLVQVLDKYKEVRYIICRSNDKWKVLAMRKSACSFENRKSLPSSWSGKRGKDLQNITGVSDAVFCHNALFMAVAQSKLGAWKLAELALIE